jgi:hypothetical protein
MPRLIRELVGAEPVDEHGITIGPPVTLPPNVEFVITIRKLNRPSDSFGELWSEIRLEGRLYRVPHRLLLESANAA